MFIDRKKYPRSHPELAAQKLAEIEDKWSKQAKDYYVNEVANPDGGNPEVAGDAHDAFYQQCQGSTIKLMMVGTPKSVAKYFDPVCNHMTGWYQGTCQKSKSFIVDQMTDDVKGNQENAGSDARTACHNIWWHLINEHKKAAHKAMLDQQAQAYQENKDNAEAEAPSAFFQAIVDRKAIYDDKVNRVKANQKDLVAFYKRKDHQMYEDHSDTMTERDAAPY